MRKVETQIDILCQPHQIISAFVEAAHLQGWWGVERCLINKNVGGIYLLAWKINTNGFGFISSGIIEKLDPDAELLVDKFVYMNPEKSSLGPMRLSIKVLSLEKGSRLILCQDGYREGFDWDWYYNAVKTAWPVVLQTLKNYIERNQKLV